MIIRIHNIFISISNLYFLSDLIKVTYSLELIYKYSYEYNKEESTIGDISIVITNYKDIYHISRLTPYEDGYINFYLDTVLGKEIKHKRYVYNLLVNHNNKYE